MFESWFKKILKLWLHITLTEFPWFKKLVFNVQDKRFLVWQIIQPRCHEDPEEEKSFNRFRSLSSYSSGVEQQDEKEITIF